MSNLLLVATEHGLYSLQREGEGWREISHSLNDFSVTSVIAREGVILAGTTDGLYRSDDLGRSWREASEGLAHRHIRWLAYHPDISDREFAGTEPAAIFVSRDGAESWRECPEVGALREEHGWFLPYSPEAGCVRGFAFHGPRAYAAVEVGGVLRSDDGGEHWGLAEGSTGKPDFHTPAQGFIAPDVHSVGVHPSSPDFILAATHLGLYRSEDGGRNWEHVYGDCYSRAFWHNLTDGDHIIFGPATPSEWNGRIEETRDGGRTWQAAQTGLEMPRRELVERFTQVGEELFAVLSNGSLFAAPLAALEWRRVLPNIRNVAAVTGMAE
jgi:photosystem II stability/assembly factor-like uncharacterized protein